MKFKDDRTPEQHETHTDLVIALDTYLSGWLGARYGKSYCAWACHPYHTEAVLQWVQGRSEMRNVKVVDSDHRPRGYNEKRGHYHIYVVRENHPAVLSLKETSAG
jgi:hypothetical protein